MRTVNIDNNPEVMTHSNFDYDERKEDEQRQQLADNLWNLIQRLTTIKSPLAHALFYVLTQDTEFQTVRARKCYVSKERFHQLINQTLDSLSDAAMVEPESFDKDDDILVFSAVRRLKPNNPNYTNKRKETKDSQFFDYVCSGSFDTNLN